MEHLFGYLKECWIAGPFLVFIAISAVYYIIYGIFITLPLRLARYIIIYKHGYPPDHCGADGKLKKERVDEDE